MKFYLLYPYIQVTKQSAILKMQSEKNDNKCLCQLNKMPVILTHQKAKNKYSLDQIWNCFNL